MLFAPQSTPPPEPAQHAASVDSQGLLDALERQAVAFPELVFQQAARLRRQDHRDRVLRLAFLTAASRRRDIAVRHLDEVVDRPWIGEVPFHDAIALARIAPAERSGAARSLLLASALRNPSLALRDVNDYRGLPFGQEVFDEAALAAAGEATLLAAGGSRLAAAVRSAFAASERPELRLLETIATRDGLDAPRRARVATLVRQIVREEMSLDRAAAVAASPPLYFAALVDERLRASGFAARGLDRALGEYALSLCRSFQDTPASAGAVLSRFPARDLYLLLAYGRAEQEDRFVTGIFDRLLLPKLRLLPKPRPLSRLVSGTGAIGFRAFAAAAILFQRWEQFLALEGSEADRAALIGQLVRGIEASAQPLDDAVTVSEIIDLTASPARLRLLSEVVATEHHRLQAEPRLAALLGVLGGRIHQKMGGASSPEAVDGFAALGERYGAYFKGKDAVEAAALFDANGICLQRHFFYYDQDGVESFESFLATHKNDPDWNVELDDAVARVSKARNGRQIVIYANIPFDLLDRENAGREDEAARRDGAVARRMRAEGGTPTVIVHRGHSYHADKTLDHVTRSTAVVFLGSCRGWSKVHSVLEVAHDAHVIASREIGSKDLNDPLLKSLNDTLLEADGSLEWAGFWRLQGARLGRVAHFSDYLPPHLNPASILLRAYYRALDELP